MTMTKVMTCYVFTVMTPQYTPFPLLGMRKRLAQRRLQPLCRKNYGLSRPFYRVSVITKVVYPTQDVYCSSFKCNLGLII